MRNILKRAILLLCVPIIWCSCNDDDTSSSRQMLESLIQQAEAIVANSNEGTEEGDIAPGSKAILQTRIEQAYYIMMNTSWDEGYDNAYKQLEDAITAFKENIVKAGIPYFNSGSKMNLGPVGEWDLTDEFTWEMKVRFDEFASGDQNIISCEQGNGAIMIRNNGSNLQFYVNDGNWQGGTCCTIELNKWYHIIATYKANDKMRFYLDGHLERTFSCGKAHVVPTCNLQLGTAPSYTNRYMRGNIQHVSIWADVRTDEEAAADVTCNFSGTEPDLKAYWPLTLNVGTEITDKTGNHVAKMIDVKWNNPE